MSCIAILYSTFANHQIKHEATSKEDSQTGNSRWSLLMFLGSLCGYVWVNIERNITLTDASFGSDKW